jgi:hypothetical protein
MGGKPDDEGMVNLVFALWAATPPLPSFGEEVDRSQSDHSLSKTIRPTSPPVHLILRIHADVEGGGDVSEAFGPHPRRQRPLASGGCHDQADAEWMEIRRLLRGHNDTPFGQPTPGRPIGRPGVGHPQGVFSVISYY